MNVRLVAGLTIAAAVAATILSMWISRPEVCHGGHWRPAGNRGAISQFIDNCRMPGGTP